MNQNQKRIPMPARYAINAALVVLAFVALNLITGAHSTYYAPILMLVGINIILAVSLNVATGYLGQLPLGHAGFMAVGGYAAGIFLKAMPMPNLDKLPEGVNAAAAHLQYNFYVVLALLLAGLVAAIFGIIIGVPALRLKGDYLAIITLGFGEIIRVVLLNIDSVLGFDFTFGASGLKRIPKAATVSNVFICVVITCLVIHMVMKSRHGRAILSIRENEIAAESCGIHTTYYPVLAFPLSAFFAGVAGALYATYVGILQPNTFGFMKSIEILVMVVLGGMGSMLGSILSATVLTALPQVLLAFDKWRMVLYSIVLILVMIFKPSGLMGTYDFSMSRLLEKFMNRFGGKKKGEAVKQ